MFKALRDRLFGDRNGESKNVARSRLHFVLVQDRSGLTNDEMAKFKEEMCNVIDKYFEVDKAGFDISYKRESETTTLLINSPVIVRRSKSDTKSEKGKKVRDSIEVSTSKDSKEEVAQQSKNKELDATAVVSS